MKTHTAAPHRVPAAFVALLVLVVSACSVEQSLPMPHCLSGDSGIIVAQSVPTAEFVPCFDDLPAGWQTSGINIDQNGTEIRFDSDRAGSGAAVVKFRSSCQTSDAVEIPSEWEDADRYEFIERVTGGFRAARHYVFDGGCISWDFDFAADAPSALSIELADRMTLFSREDLNKGIAESFIDAEV